MIARRFRIGRLRAHVYIAQGYFNFSVWRVVPVLPELQSHRGGEAPFPGAGLDMLELMVN